MTRYSAHPAVVYDVPLNRGVEIMHPETVILRFKNGNTVDVGALCYLVRAPVPKTPGNYRRKNEGRLVELSSFDATRAVIVRSLINHVSDQLALSGLRTHTVYGNFSRFLGFMAWADSAGQSNVLRSEADAREGIRSYSTFLRELANTNAVTVNTAARMLMSAQAVLGEFLQIDDLTRGVNLLQRTSAATEPTVPPGEDDQAKVLALCEALFLGLSDLVVNNKQYPYQMKMPSYLRWPGNALYVFPSTSWCMPPYILEKRDTLQVPRWGYDFANGKIATLDQLRSIRSYCREDDSFRRKIIRDAQQQLDLANTDFQCVHRRQAAAQALNAFIVMFIAQTGMNPAQVFELPWSGDYEVTTTRQHFRIVKYRAGGKVVTFELPQKFMPLFKRYLALREFLLNGQQTTLLFVSMGHKAAGNPCQVKAHAPQGFNRTLKFIDPDIAVIAPRQWRAAKSDWLIRNTDPATTALVLQNSPRVVLASYAAGSETTHLEEMTGFLDRMATTVIERSESLQGAVSRATGVCTSYGAANKIAIDGAPQPDCKSAEGCLFCDKFKVHADDRDTRKLLSCRYCLLKSSQLLESEERATALIQPIIVRIQQILNEISCRDAEMVARIEREVTQDGELDAYWASKLQLLMDLGVTV